MERLSLKAERLKEALRENLQYLVDIRWKQIIIENMTPEGKRFYEIFKQCLINRIMTGLENYEIKLLD